MQIDLKKFKVEKPQPKYQFTSRIIELTQKLLPLQKKIFFKFNKLYSDTPYADPQKLMKKLYDASPDLFKQVNVLGLELEKEKFKEAYGEDLVSVEAKALNGNRSSWLKLLKWNIEYLEREQLRKIIYEESTNSKSAFLKEVGRIISNPKRFHANLKTENYTHFILTYDPEKSIDKNLNMLTDYLEGLHSSGLIEESDVVTPDRRQIMRVFKKRKKK